MRFDFNGDTFRLVFEHKQTPKWVETYVQGEKTIAEVMRSETKVILYKRGRMLNPGDETHPPRYEWDEVSHAGVRQYYKDAYSREEARKAALRRLSKHIDKTLREPLWKCYINRFEPSS